MYPLRSESSSLASRLLTSEPWEFSPREFTAAFWRSRATSLDHLRIVLLEALFESSRDPSYLAKQEAFVRDQRIVEKSLAFGQHLYPLQPDRREYGQLGLYGCAAAVETLCRSSEIQSYITGGKGEGPQRRLQKRMLEALVRTWLFIDLAFLNFSENPRSKFWEQSRTTLRSLHVLRAASAAYPVFQRLMGEDDWEEYSDFWPSTTPVESCVRVGEKVVEHMRSIRAPGASGFEMNFAFALGAEEVPSSPDDWLFMVSSAIVALIRAYSSELIAEEDLVGEGKELLTSRGVERVVEVAAGESLAADLRCRLFACFALAHISDKFRKNFPSRIMPPARLRLSPGEERRLESTVIELARSLLASPAGLFDLHSPYHIFVKGDSRPHYRDDYFVVPVVPVLLSSVGLITPRHLYSRRVVGLLGQLVHYAKGSFGQAFLQALPFQVEPYNGTMNIGYYAEGMMIAQERYRQMGFKDILLTQGQRLRERSRLFIVVSMALVMLWLFVIDPESHPVAQGVVMGTLASVLAALMAPRMVKWWYGGDPKTGGGG